MPGVQLELGWPVLSDAEITAILNPNNPICPFYNYIGNREAVEIALDLAFSAFSSRNADGIPNRECNKRIALLAPPGTGKTLFAKIFTKTLGLPFVETDASQLNNAAKLFDSINNVLTEYDIPLVAIKEAGSFGFYKVPPSVLFIDEVHGLRGAVQDSLLKMLETNDGRLILTRATLDCTHMCIIVATTDKGKLRPAFKRRFIKITLKRHTTDELAQIVGNAYKWNRKDCLAIASVSPNAGEALQLAESVKASSQRTNKSISDSIPIVAERLGIGNDGINSVAIAVLELLRDEENGLSRKAICSALGIEEDEFANDCLPFLMANSRHPSYITISNRHKISEAGRRFLEQKSNQTP